MLQGHTSCRNVVTVLLACCFLENLRALQAQGTRSLHFSRALNCDGPPTWRGACTSRKLRPAVFLHTDRIRGGSTSSNQFDDLDDDLSSAVVAVPEGDENCEFDDSGGGLNSIGHEGVLDKNAGNRYPEDSEDSHSLMLGTNESVSSSANSNSFPLRQPWQDAAGVNITNTTILGSRLLIAASGGQVEAVKLLIQHGVDLNFADTSKERKGWTALHCAAAKGRTATFGVLFRLGANLSAVDQYNATALHYAADRGRTACCRALIEMGMEVNAKTHPGLFTPLHYAAMRGWRGTCVLLLELGADASLMSNWDETPAKTAETCFEPELAKFLEYVAEKQATGRWTVKPRGGRGGGDRLSGGKRPWEHAAFSARAQGAPPTASHSGSRRGGGGEAARQPMAAGGAQHHLRGAQERTSKLILRNLPLSVQEIDLRELFHAKDVPEPRHVKILYPRDNPAADRTSAIIDCDSLDAAEAARLALHGSKVHDPSLPPPQQARLVSAVPFFHQPPPPDAGMHTRGMPRRGPGPWRGRGSFRPGAGRATR